MHYEEADRLLKQHYPKEELISCYRFPEQHNTVYAEWRDTLGEPMTNRKLVEFIVCAVIISLENEWTGISFDYFVDPGIPMYGVETEPMASKIGITAEGEHVGDDFFVFKGVVLKSDLNFKTPVDFDNFVETILSESNNNLSECLGLELEVDEIDVPDEDTFSLIEEVSNQGPSFP